VATKYTKWPHNIPNGHKINQQFPLQDPPKFTQIGIFGLKTNHLAALNGTLFGGLTKNRLKLFVTSARCEIWRLRPMS
jgi:hypothetical protein